MYNMYNAGILSTYEANTEEAWYIICMRSINNLRYRVDIHPNIGYQIESPTYNANAWTHVSLRIIV